MTIRFSSSWSPTPPSLSLIKPPHHHHHRIQSGLFGQQPFLWLWHSSGLSLDWKPAPPHHVHLNFIHQTNENLTLLGNYRTGWFFLLFLPIFSTKMKNNGQPIRDSVPWNSRCTKDPRWLNNVFIFSTEIWAEQLKKSTLYRMLQKLTKCSNL